MTSPNKTGGRAMFILLATAALATADTTAPVPGTVNYAEGQVTLNGENLPAPNAGPVAVETNRVLDTVQGKSGLLLIAAPPTLTTSTRMLPGCTRTLRGFLRLAARLSRSWHICCVSAGRRGV